MSAALILVKFKYIKGYQLKRNLIEIEIGVGYNWKFQLSIIICTIKFDLLYVQPRPRLALTIEF